MFARPTKRGWLALVIATGTFFVAMVNVSMTATIVSALLWALLPISLLMACFSLHGITVQREPLQDGVRLRSLPMPVTIVNHQRRYRQAIVIGERCGFSRPELVFTMVQPLKPHERRYIMRSILPVHRGEYDLDEILLRGGDPAGLFYREKRFSFPQHVAIFPSISHLNNVPLQLRNRVIASSTGQPIGVSGLGQEFFGVRPYRPTDGIRFIHWKASARQHELMVREFEENTVNQVSLFLDTSADSIGGHGDETNFERLVETAASLISYLSGVYCRMLFVTNLPQGVLVRYGSGPDLSNEIMRDLANLRPVQRHLIDAFDQTLEKVSPNSVVYLLSLSDSSDLSGVIDALFRLNADIRYVVATAQSFRPSRRPHAHPESATERQPTPVYLTPTSDLARILGHA